MHWFLVLLTPERRYKATMLTTRMLLNTDICNSFCPVLHFRFWPKSSYQKNQCFYAAGMFMAQSSQRTHQWIWDSNTPTHTDINTSFPRKRLCIDLNKLCACTVSLWLNRSLIQRTQLRTGLACYNGTLMFQFIQKVHSVCANRCT